MTARECLTAIFNHEKYEYLPCIEWATWWNLTIEAWQRQGLDKSLHGKALMEHFGLDYHNQTWISAGDGHIKDEADYEVIKHTLFSKERVYGLADHFRNVHEQYEKNGDITWFSLDGYFWFPRKLFGIEEHFYSFYDYPELYHRICRDMTDYYLFLIDEILKHFSPQFMTIAEDMSYNLGPMLSEELFDEFLKPYYRQIIPLLHSHNVKVIVDSDGDVTKMLPWLIDAGVDGILPLERQAGVDVNVLTEQYPNFFFLGGYDKMVMKFGREAQVKEFERILPSIRRGNLIPSVDHQTPPDVTIENYRIYCELLRKYCNIK